MYELNENVTVSQQNDNDLSHVMKALLQMDQTFVILTAE